MATLGSKMPPAFQDRSKKNEDSLQEVPDFSLVLGGPLYQLLRRAHLEGEALQMMHRRIIASVLLTWVPLLLLSSLTSTDGAAGRISFIRDIEVHSRFLLALPILIAAELIVHLRIRPLVRRFVEYRIVLPKDMPVFRTAVYSALKVRNSIAVEALLLVAVYGLGLWLWGSRGEPGLQTWYASAGGRWNLTAAGYWYVFVSIPVFQFLLLRWYMRLFVWFRFLWQVNRIPLNLISTHPDRCAGLSFVGKSAYAYAPILFAQGVILAGVVADRVLYRGETLQSFKFQIGGFVVFLILVVLGPLLMFTPRMASTKRQGLSEYGLFAQRYVEGFDVKWIHGTVPSDELLGSGDIQSLADLANSYQLVRDMRVVPFGLQDISRLALATAAPLSPLLLTIFSFEELVVRIVKIVF